MSERVDVNVTLHIRNPMAGVVPTNTKPLDDITRPPFACLPIPGSITDLAYDVQREQEETRAWLAKMIGVDPEDLS